MKALISTLIITSSLLTGCVGEFYAPPSTVRCYVNPRYEVYDSDPVPVLSPPPAIPIYYAAPVTTFQPGFYFNFNRGYHHCH